MEKQTFIIVKDDVIDVEVLINENDTFKNISQKALSQYNNGNIDDYFIVFGDFEFNGDELFRKYQLKNKDGVIFLRFKEREKDFPQIIITRKFESVNLTH